jgi:oligoendopeptidase F
MAKKRSEIEQRWDVEALYPDEKAWLSDFERLDFSGLLPLKEGGRLEELLTLYFDLDRAFSKLYTWAHLKFDEDVRSELYKDLYGRIQMKGVEFAEASSWIEPKLIAVKGEVPRYRFYVEKVRRLAPHTLGEKEEAILASSGKALAAPSKAFGALNNGDLKFEPAIDGQGKKRELTTGTYMRYLKEEDRELRKSAFIHLHSGYLAHENLLAELLQGQVEAHQFMAKSRGYKSSLQASLFPHGIDETVYRNLIKTVREHISILHDYVRMRKQVLALSEHHVYDLHVPLVVEGKEHFSYDKARQLVVDSVRPMGTAYQERLREGLFGERWVDPFENEGKRSGAYSSGCYDSRPYILMNYQGTLNDVLTLAHEAGHSMHSDLSRKHQPYFASQYPIFLAEIASTLNEQLLLDELKGKVDPKVIINYKLEGMRGTIFRQTLFAEFELAIHEWVESGRPLTVGWLKDKYLELNAFYYGPDLVLDGGVEIEWARIPHFYYNFYVYQYATGLASAIALHEELNPERVLTFLSSGGSDYPIPILKRAGVDLTDPAPIRSAMRVFQQLTKEFA